MKPSRKCGFPACRIRCIIHCGNPLSYRLWAEDQLLAFKQTIAKFVLAGIMESTWKLSGEKRPEIAVLFGWLVGRSVGWLVGWLIGWLINRMVGPSRSKSLCNWRSVGLSVSQSWLRAPCGTHDHIFLKCVRSDRYSVSSREAPSLTRGRFCQLSSGCRRLSLSLSSR